MRSENPGPDYFIFLLALSFWVAIIVAPDDARPFVLGGGVVAGALWLLRHFADRDDARRAHSLLVEQERAKQEQQVWQARERETP